MVASFINFYGKTCVVFSLNIRKRFFLVFSFQSQQKELRFFLKSSTRYFQNSPQFERSAGFYVTIRESLKRSQFFNFEKNSMENENLFQKKWSTVFQLKPLRLKTHQFYSKLLCQKPMLRQNGPITKSGVLLVAAYFFLENFFQFQNLLKRVNLMYQQPKCQYSYFL